MTNEEAIERIEDHKIILKMEVPRAIYLLEALEMAIKSLKHEDVLDKIRTEMESEIISHSGTGEEVIQAYVDGLSKAIKIIDKYRERQENE